MKILFLLIIVSMSFISCDSDSWKEITAGIIADGATPVVAKIASCSGIDAIKEDMKERIMQVPWLKKSDVKKAKANKGIASALCITVVVSVVPMLVNAGVESIPKDWKCTGSFAEASLKELAKKSCASLP